MKKYKEHLAWLAYFIGGLASFLLFIGFLSQHFYAAEVCAILLPVWTVTLVTVTSILFVLKKKYLATFYGLIACVGVNFLWSCLSGPSFFEDHGAASETVVSFNLHSSNQDFTKFKDWITELEPDFILLQELTPRWSDLIKRDLSSLYPKQKLLARTDNFGVGILVHQRHADKSLDFIVHELSGQIPALELRIDSQALFSVHLMPPLNRELHQLRESQLRDLALLCKLSGPEILVGGDFNCLPWTASFRAFVEESELRHLNSALALSWPASRPLLALDHFFWRGKQQIFRMSVGPDLGSDHRPILLKYKP